MAIDIFLVIPKIPDGPPIDEDENPIVAAAFPNATAIPLNSFSFGASHPADVAAAGGGNGAGKVTLSPLSITKFVDKASPSLFGACTSGAHFATAQLYLQKSDAPAAPDTINFFTFELTEVFITSIEWSGSAGNELPVESLSVNFAKVVVTYTSQNADGTAGAVTQSGWDLSTNKSV